MISLGGQRVFREFLHSEYSEENILFWLACEELKQAWCILFCHRCGIVAIIWKLEK